MDSTKDRQKGYEIMVQKGKIEKVWKISILVDFRETACERDYLSGRREGLPLGSINEHRCRSFEFRILEIKIALNLNIITRRKLNSPFWLSLLLLPICINNQENHRNCPLLLKVSKEYAAAWYNRKAKNAINLLTLELLLAIYTITACRPMHSVNKMANTIIKRIYKSKILEGIPSKSFTQWKHV